jgi:lysophospholipase L1-like esterase
VHPCIIKLFTIYLLNQFKNQFSLKLLLLLLLLTCGCVGLTVAQNVSPFKTGDRVVFVGNSITDGGHYHSYIWLYYLTRFPERRIEVYNAGIGGDVSQQMYERLQKEVLDRKPTVVTLTFGMNDTGYQQLSGHNADSVYAAKVSESLKGFNHIERIFLQHPEFKKIMIASSPYDELSKIKTKPLLNKNAAMLKIADAELAVAHKNKWSFVDFNRPMTAINQHQQTADSMFTMQGTDRIHPTNDGHMVMAYLFLKAQGMAGKKVAEFALNVNGNTKPVIENCKLSELNISPQHITFTYLARSLPYPVDTFARGGNSNGKSQAEALKLVPFTAEFNQEVFRVKGFDKARIYELRIDDKLVGAWTGEKFEKGINLAELTNTPQYEQATAAMQINEERWEVERRLREYYWLHYSILKPKGLLFNDQLPVIDSLQKYAKKDFFVAVTLPTYRKARYAVVREAWQKEIAMLTEQMYAISQPVPHHFEVALKQ